MKRNLRWAAFALALCLTLSACQKDGGKEPSSSDGSQTSSGPPEPGTSQQTPANGQEKNSVNYWLGKLSTAEGSILDAAAIEAFNAQIVQEPQTKCVDVAAYPASLDKAALTALLDASPIPDDERYIGSAKADAAYYNKLTANQNKGAIVQDNPVTYGYAVNNTILRTFPTGDPSYEFPNDIEFDLFSETMLKVWEPVLILHTSADKEWLLVQSRNYCAWAAAKDIAAASAREEWERYLNPQNPLVVTGNRVTLNENVYHQKASGLELFMGTVLPLVPEQEIPQAIDGVSKDSGYAVYLPERSSDGKLTVSQALIPWNADVREGYLPYTQGAVLRQAFKLLGDRHGWSGMNKSRDTSSAMVDVFGAFGIRLPRNTTQQAHIPGQTEDVSQMEDSDKREALLEQRPGSLFIMDGHVMLYLGAVDGTPYVLHSLYVAYDESGTEEIINAIVVTDLSLRDKDGDSYLGNIHTVKTIG